MEHCEHGIPPGESHWILKALTNPAAKRSAELGVSQINLSTRPFYLVTAICTPALVFLRLPLGNAAFQPNPKLCRSDKSPHTSYLSVHITQPFPDEKGPIHRVRRIRHWLAQMSPSHWRKDYDGALNSKSLGRWWTRLFRKCLTIHLWQWQAVLLSSRIGFCYKTLTQDYYWSPWHWLRKMERASWEWTDSKTHAYLLLPRMSGLPAHKDTGSHIFPYQTSDSQWVCSTHPSWDLCHSLIGTRCSQLKPFKAKHGMSPPAEGPLCISHHQTQCSFLLGPF